MSDEIYHKLAKMLDSLPNGFPPSESGVEIKLLKRIFRPEDIELFLDLKLRFESAENIAERTGRPLDGLEERMVDMANRGQILKVELDDVIIFKMLPWAFGIYEFQLNNMDKEMAEMCEEYMEIFAGQLLQHSPPPMRTIPVEKEIPVEQQALPYDSVSNIIENSHDFLLSDCICKKEKHLVGDGCDNTKEICLALAPLPGAFKNYPLGRRISKEEAIAVLDKAEEEGLVHLTWNTAKDPMFICNCCGCCCLALRAINELNMKGINVINSSYYAEIDQEECEVCGVCKDDRCQLNAIEEEDEACRVINELCIGCGVCVSACPTGAIKLKRKPEDQIPEIPTDDTDWYEKRAQARGIDVSHYTVK